jgi:hypothetical protein
MTSERSIKQQELYGRFFALVYLLDIVAMIGGVVAVFGSNYALWAVLTFGGAGLVMCALANILARKDADLRARRGGPLKLSPYQVGWYRLTLGREVPRSLRVLSRRY